MEYVGVKIHRNEFVIRELFEIIGADGFICGGFARYCCSPLPFPIEARDIDVYCYDEESFARLEEKLDKHETFERKKATPVSISYTRKKWPSIQLIKTLDKGNVKLVGSPQEVLDHFDFTIARVAITSPHAAFADNDFLEHEMEKKLVIKAIHCPLAQVYRVAKYIRKGYWINVIEVMKILADWEERPDEYKLKLEEYLRSEELSQEDIDDLERLLHID